MRIGRDVVKEWDGHSWQLRHEPTGLKSYLGKESPAEEKIQQQYRTLLERVKEVQKYDQR